MRDQLFYNLTDAHTCTETCFDTYQLCSGKAAEYQVDELQNFRMVPSAVLTSEKEEAKAFLTLFLKNQGLSSSVAARTINKSDHFIDHLVSRLHSVHKTWYLVGSISSTISFSYFHLNRFQLFLTMFVVLSS